MRTLENICHFIPEQKNYHTLQIINFVLETKEQIFEKRKTEAVKCILCAAERVFYTWKRSGIR